MTSSVKIRQRFKDSLSFGPWYDHYVRPQGKCHPDFDTILLSDDARGVKVCVRKKHSDLIEKSPKLGIYRYSRQLYNPSLYPQQIFNKRSRVPPNEEFLLLNDYYKLIHDFNGTGVYRKNTVSFPEFAF